MEHLTWGMRGKASVLVDGQFGSTGKGLAAAWLSQFCPNDVIATTNAGANAGHTTKFADGTGFLCFHLPTTGVMKSASLGGRALSYINAGSIIEPKVLEQEMEACGVTWGELFIHPRAAIIDDTHRAAERAAGSSTEKSGSTQKGVGAAMADKIMRRAKLASDYYPIIAMNGGMINLNDQMRGGRSVVVEVPQGMDLSLNHGLAYPYCTSRDCWVGSGLNDAGIHPSFLGAVCMVVRTFPIRVGNIYNEMGEQLGSSGPFYPDSAELDWALDFPDIEPERTTVTKRVRRIATWSDQQYFHALSMNRPNIVFLNFANYLRGVGQLQNLRLRMRSIESDVGLHNVKHVYGFGPCVEDVTDDLHSAILWYKNRGF